LRAREGSVDGMASHVLVCGLVTGNLNQLDSTQHCNPDQLENDPDVEDESECISGNIVT